MDLAAPQYVECSWTRDRTCVPCIGKRILNHRTARDVFTHIFSAKSFLKNDIMYLKMLKFYEIKVRSKKLR